MPIGPDTLLRGMTAALIGGMMSFPRAVVGAIAIGILDQVLFFNFTNETGLVQFVLFLIVLVLVARVSRQRQRVERRELPVRAAHRRGPGAAARDLVGPAHAAARRGRGAARRDRACRSSSDKSERHQT